MYKVEKFSTAFDRGTKETTSREPEEVLRAVLDLWEEQGFVFVGAVPDGDDPLLVLHVGA